MSALPFINPMTGAPMTVPDGARLECGVCWQVYDPAEGDGVRQVPPGTPFVELPDDWSCPTCDSPRDRFLVIDGEESSEQPAAGLVAAYREKLGTMRDLGVAHPALAVEAIGFRSFADGWIGVVIAPWFMNLTLLARDPDAWAARQVGDAVRRELPAGPCDFTVAAVDGGPRHLVCSLFSPMFEFEDQAAARRAAEAALAAVLEPIEAPPVASPASSLGRRGFLFGRLNSDQRGG